MKRRATLLVLVLLVIILLLVGCGKTDTEQQSTEAVKSTRDEETVQTSYTEGFELSWNDFSRLSYTLNNSIDWETLYYENLRSLDQNQYTGCALIYLNNDDIPELIVKSSNDMLKSFIYYISEDGLFLSKEKIDSADDLWYLERQNRYLYSDESLGNIESAKAPDMVSIEKMLSRLKDERKDPGTKADEYSSNADTMVTTFKEVTGSAVFNNETTPLSYRIPQIIISGDDIESINQAILEDMLEYVNGIEQEINAGKDDIWPCTYKTIDYKAYLNNGVFSLVIEKKGLGSGATDASDGPDRTIIYNIEASTGKKINNICLLNSFEIDSAKVTEAFNKEVKANYDSIKNDPDHPLNNPDFGYDESTYDSLYYGTIEQFSPVGYYNRMYFDDDGNLNIVYWYKWVAGSEFYEKVMTLNKEDII